VHVGQHQPADAGDGCASAATAATHAHAIAQRTIRVMRSRMQRVQRAVNSQFWTVFCVERD
jgi:hypothetical protein